MSVKREILLVSDDRALGASLAEAAKADADFDAAFHAAGVETAVDPSVAARADALVVDVDAGRRDHLVALQALMARAAGKPVVVVTADAVSEPVQRWFMQIHIHDLLRKPIGGAEILGSCRSLSHGQPAPPSDYAEVTSFLPAAGGVGNTTLAIEAAMQILDAEHDKKCVALVDLDLDNDACADFLDLEPRLDFGEIGESGERLDPQLLEAMTSRHASGLALIAAPSPAGQMRQLQSGAVLRVLDVVSTHFRHVVIDLPRTWRPWTDGVLLGSDRIFLVTDMTVPGLRFARRVADQVNRRLSLKSPLGVIVNRAERRLFPGAGLRRAEVVEALGGVFVGDIPNNYQLVREAIDQGVPLETVKAGNNVSTGLKRILFAEAREERRAS